MERDGRASDRAGARMAARVRTRFDRETDASIDRWREGLARRAAPERRSRAHVR